MRNSLWGVRRRSQGLELQRIAPNEVIYIVGLPAAPGPVSNGEVLSWRVNSKILHVSIGVELPHNMCLTKLGYLPVKRSQKTAAVGGFDIFSTVTQRVKAPPVVP
jgi:hypothetical protein